MRPLLLAGAVFALLSLGACRARAAPATPTPDAQPARGASPDAAASTVPPPAGTSPWSITLERSGGFIGRTERFVVNPDGTVVVRAATRRAAGDAAAAAALQGRLEAIGLYRVPSGRYLPARPGPDRFTFELTIAKDGQQYRYVTAEEAANAPPALVQALALIQEHIATAR